MDPVSHAVIGRAVAAACRLDRDGRRGTTTAAILGALSPDVDFVLMPIAWDIYLRAHVVGTHAVAGAVVTGLGSAGLVWLLAGRGRFLPLARVAVPAAISHVAADIVTGGRLHAGWPLVDSMTTLPLVAMHDPWTIAVLSAGLVLLWRSRAGMQRAARILLLGLALFLGAKGLLLWSALGSMPEAGDEAVRLVDAEWASLTRWTLIERTPVEIRRWSIRALGPSPALELVVPVGVESPLVRRSRALDTVMNFLAAHEMAFPTERRTGATSLVLWSDVRFCRPVRDGERPRCVLWFGGLFDHDGRPLQQEVHVVSWIQTRGVE